MLDAVPVHASAHGFVAGRLCLTGAQIHASEAVVAAFDLAQFFLSIGVPPSTVCFAEKATPGPSLGA
jgi:hypothetical protein